MAFGAVNASLDVGINPAAEKRKQRREHAEATVTFAELFEQYRDDLIGEQKKGVAGVVWNFERHLGALPSSPAKKHGRERTKAKGAVNWQHRRLSTIRSEDVGRLRAALATNISPTTANRVMELVKAVFNFGKRLKLHACDNPAADLPKFKLQSRERWIEAHEAQKFFGVLNSEADADFQARCVPSDLHRSEKVEYLADALDELSLPGVSWRLTGNNKKR